MLVRGAAEATACCHPSLWSLSSQAATPGSGAMPTRCTNSRYSSSFACPIRSIRSELGAEPRHDGMIESLRWPKVARNCSRVMTMPSLAIVSRHAIQCSSSESTSVPSMSHSTALDLFIRKLLRRGARPTFSGFDTVRKFAGAPLLPKLRNPPTTTPSRL